MINLKGNAVRPFVQKISSSASKIAILAMLAGGGTAFHSATAQQLVINDTGTPTSVGTGLGKRAIWVGGGAVGGTSVDIVAEIIAGTLDHTFDSTANRPSVVSVGQDDMRVRWYLFQSGSYDVNFAVTDPANASATQVTADIFVQINDVDGPNNEQLFVPVCDGTVDFVRIDIAATTGRQFGTVAGLSEIFSLIGDANYNNEPVSGLEISYSSLSQFEFGRTADANYLVRLDNPTYTAANTLDFQCADFSVPVANPDAAAGITGNATSVSVLTNDVIATDNDNGPNNAHGTASEYAMANVSLIPPGTATTVVVDAGGQTISFTVPGEGDWAYNDLTGQAAFTPAANFTQSPTPINYEYINALGVTSNQALVTINYPAVVDGAVTITPTSQPGDALTITVNDIDLSGSGTTSVTVANLSTGEAETVSLTESGVTPGLFIGTVATTFGASNDGAANGSLNTQSGDTVQVSYTDAVATTGYAVVRTADDTVSGGANGTVTITPTSFPGDMLNIQVTDADLAGDGTVLVNVANGTTGGAETVTLTENGTVPGEFNGTVNTSFGTSADGTANGSLNSAASDTITVTYGDLMDAAGSPQSRTANDTVGGGITGSVSITNSLVPGDTVNISVTDADLDTTGAADTIQVVTVNDGTSESELLTLTETGANTGIFLGTAATVFGTSAGPDNDGTFNVQGAEMLTVTYQDALTVTGATAAPTSSGVVAGGVNGAIVYLSPLSPGAPVQVQVSDADLDTDPNAIETVSVTVVNDVTGESEAVLLTETGIATGIFTADLTSVFATSAGADNDSNMGIQAGDTLTATYQDALTSTGGTATPNVSDTVVGGITGTIEYLSSIIPGNDVTARVTDSDLDVQALVVDTVTVVITNDATGEFETVTLSETGASTGVFEGPLPSVFSVVADANDDGDVGLQSGDTLTAVYQDAYTATGGTGSPQVTAGANGGIDGTISYLSAVVPGANLLVEVVDGDLDTNPAVAESVSVFVINDMTGESENLLLTETGANTGVFTGPLVTAFATTAGVNNDAVLGLQAGETVTTTYLDAITASGGTASPSVTDGAVGGADGSITSTPMIISGQDIFVTVTDADLNLSAGVAEVIPVTLLNDQTGESETLNLTETGASTGVFSASILTVYGIISDTNNNGEFAVASGNTVTATYTDGVTATGGSAVLTSVTNVTNQPPVAADDSLSTPPGTTVSVPVLANDVDPEGQPLTITGVTQPPSGVVTFLPGGTVLYTPADGFTGTESFTYTISDGQGGTDTATISVTVDGDTPTATADSGATLPGTPVVLPVTTNDNDPNNDPLSVQSVTQPPNGTVTINPDGTLTYLPDTGFVGTDTFSYVACDTAGNCDTAVVTMNVSADAPQAIDDIVAIDSGYSVEITPLGNDIEPNNDPMTIVDITDPANGVGTLNPNGTVTYTPNPGFVGADIITYRVCDDNGFCDTATITINVGNRPPVAMDDSLTAPPGQSTSVPVLTNDSDPEGSALTISDVTQPQNGVVTFTPEGGLVYVPDDGFGGVDAFTYTIEDEHGAADSATVTMTVDYDTPTSVSDSAVTIPGQPLVLDVLTNDTDPNADPLTIAEVTPPDNGTAVINLDGTITYTPAPGFVGTDTFTYTACDNFGNCDTAIVTVLIDTDTPQASDDVLPALPGQPVTVSPLLNDTDPNGDPLTVTDVTDPANGIVVLNPDGTITYTPDDEFNGVETITYTICDSDGNCDTAAITFDVRTTATVSGTVYLDADNDETLDEGESVEAGYVVEVVTNDEVIATVETDEYGQYSFSGLTPAVYDIVFRHPETNVQVGSVVDLEAAPGETILDQNLPIDPSGVVYDVTTGEPISGATLVLTDGAGSPLPSACLIDGSQQPQVTGSDGFYRFDVVPGADAACPVAETNYIIQLTMPDGTPAQFGGAAQAGPLDATTCPIDAVTTTADCEVYVSTSPPTDGSVAPFFLSFALASGDPNVVNNHLPLRLDGGYPFSVMKSANTSTATTGSIIAYTLTVTNTLPNAVQDADIVDIPPKGLKYLEGSAKINGVPADPIVRSNGSLEWDSIDFAADESVSINLGFIVGAGARQGVYVNTGVAEANSTGVQLSNLGTATVKIVPDEVFDCSEVIGKVYVDANTNGMQNNGERGLGGVKIATATGLIVTTDEHGRYHIACAATPATGRGSNFVLKVDPRSLPTGYGLFSENPRVVRLTQGKMSKANFSVIQTDDFVVTLSPDAFIEGSNEIKPDALTKLKSAVAGLPEDSDRITLVYAGAGKGPERLTRLTKTIEAYWQKTRGTKIGVDTFVYQATDMEGEE